MVNKYPSSCTTVFAYLHVTRAVMMSLRQRANKHNNSIFKPSDTRLSTQPSTILMNAGRWMDGWDMNGGKRRTRTAASEQRNSNSRSPEDDVKLPTWMMKYSRGEEINTKVTIRPSKQISVKRERSEAINYIFNKSWMTKTCNWNGMMFLR